MKPTKKNEANIFADAGINTWDLTDRNTGEVYKGIKAATPLQAQQQIVQQLRTKGVPKSQADLVAEPQGGWEKFGDKGQQQKPVGDPAREPYSPDAVAAGKGKGRSALWTQNKDDDDATASDEPGTGYPTSNNTLINPGSTATTKANPVRTSASTQPTPTSMNTRPTNKALGLDQPGTKTGVNMGKLAAGTTPATPQQQQATTNMRTPFNKQTKQKSQDQQAQDEASEFDFSDTNDHRGRAGSGPSPGRPSVRRGPNPDAPRQNPTSHLPGLPPERRRQDEMGVAGIAGFQRPLGDQDEGLDLRAIIRTMVSEIVRKKKGGGGYVLYSPNRGKKNPPKAVGEFPTKAAAKQAELSRFPPRDPKALERARKKVDKTKKKRESIARDLSHGITEALFKREEMPGSPWDEKIMSMSPEAMASDKRLMKLHKAVDHGSLSSLGDAHKGLVKALKGVKARVHPGELGRDPQGGKHFIPCQIEVGKDRIGPIHLYVDGGHVRIEVSPEASQAIGALEPDTARDLRGALLSFQEDHLPGIDHARKAVEDRDGYLEKIHGKLDGMVGKLSPVQHHLLRHIMRGRRR